MIRIAENGGAENGGAGKVVAGEPAPENPDASTSAANSFLLAGGVGDVATPGEGRGGRRGMRDGGMGFGGGPAAELEEAQVAPSVAGPAGEVGPAEGLAGAGAASGEEAAGVAGEPAAGVAIAPR